MQPSQLNSVNLPNVGDPTIAAIVKAATIPLRCAVRNVGPVGVLLSHNPATLSDVTAFADTYPLAPTEELIIVLTPGESLYAAGSGAGGRLALAISEAFPIKWEKA